MSLVMFNAESRMRFPLTQLNDLESANCFTFYDSIVNFLSRISHFAQRANISSYDTLLRAQVFDLFASNT